jgi:gluconate 2-dehydrogenase gamma chain
MTGVGFGGGMLLMGWGCAQRSAAQPWQVLTDPEARLLEAMTEQIIPADQDPGAKNAGCIHFIDRQLAGFYNTHVDTYRRGLIGVDQSSQLSYGKTFLACAWDEQTEVMKDLESGKAQGAIWQEISSRQFFNLVRDHTMQAFYGSPRHGGNKHYISYRMMGLDYPQIVGQNRYRDI